jgi:glycosyltransferase involved in cell wall biosynthesis
MSLDVVIPTYDRLDYLFESLKSVLKQSVKIDVVYVIDDNSSYDLSDFNKALDGIELNGIKVEYYRNEINQGACFSRNRGAKLSKADYVAYLDDDDIWELNHLYNLLSLIEEDNVVLAYSGKKIRNFETGKERCSYKKIPFENQYQHLLKCNYPGSTSSIIVKRIDMINCGGFDEVLSAIQDYDLYLRLIKQGIFKSNSEATMIYRNDTSLKITKQVNKGIASANIILAKYSQRDKKNLNLTLTLQNFKKCIRHFQFRLMPLVLNSFLKNRK